MMLKIEYCDIYSFRETFKTKEHILGSWAYRTLITGESSKKGLFFKKKKEGWKLLQILECLSHLLHLCLLLRVLNRQKQMALELAR